MSILMAFFWTGALLGSMTIFTWFAVGNLLFPGLLSDVGAPNGMRFSGVLIVMVTYGLVSAFLGGAILKSRRFARSMKVSRSK